MMSERQWTVLMVVSLIANLVLARVMTDLEIIRYTLVSFFVLACWWLVHER